jgi:hypothetical protein
MLALAGGAAAQDEPWDEALARSLAGTWVLAVPEETARASIEAGIAAATAGLPPLVDGLAARELRARLVLAPTITFVIASDRIEARFPHASFSTAPGAPATYPVPDAAPETMEVVQLLRGGRLEQIFTTRRGRRWSTYTVADDGARMTLDAVVRSDRLATDVRYRIPYRRAR